MLCADRNVCSIQSFLRTFPYRCLASYFAIINHPFPWQRTIFSLWEPHCLAWWLYAVYIRQRNKKQASSFRTTSAKGQCSGKKCGRTSGFSIALRPVLVCEGCLVKFYSIVFRRKRHTVWLCVHTRAAVFCALLNPGNGFWDKLWACKNATILLVVR